MGADVYRYGAIMLIAGIGIPTMAAMNAQLGARLGSPPAATIVFFCVALLLAMLTTAATTGFAPLAALAAQPPYLMLAGLFVAFYVLSISWVAPRFGIVNAIMCVLLGQMLAATAIDHFGLFGAPLQPLTLKRGVGLALMAVGLVCVQWR